MIGIPETLLTNQKKVIPPAALTPNVTFKNLMAWGFPESPGLRLGAPNAGGMNLILSRGTKNSHATCCSPPNK